MYSHLTGLGKGLKSFVIFAGSIAIVALIQNFGQVSIWDLAVKYIQPMIGSLTVGALLTYGWNYVKVKWLS